MAQRDLAATGGNYRTQDGPIQRSQVHHSGKQEDRALGVGQHVHPFAPNMAFAMCIFVLPLIVRSRIAPREIENCWADRMIREPHAATARTRTAAWRWFIS